MTGGVVRCGHCGTANRVPAAAAGTPRCGKCHQPLLWIADADDATFAEVAEAAKIPVVADLRAPWCGPCRMVSPALEQLARDLAGKAKLVKVSVVGWPDRAAGITQCQEFKGALCALLWRIARYIP